MTDEDIIGYLLDALDADDRVVVEAQLRANPDAAVRLEQLRLAFAPLEADRELELAAPSGLAVRTVARLAAHLVEHEPRQTSPSNVHELAAIHQALEEPGTASDDPPVFLATPLPRAPREEPETRAVGGRFRPDLLVACAIALFASGLVISAVSKVRAQNQMLACQNTLHTMHTGLAGYADTHDGNYPQIGVGSNLTADSFATVLVSSGQVPQGFRPACPACPVSDPTNPTLAVGYTYTLGYRSDNTLCGLRRPGSEAEEHDLMPISADYPTPDAAPIAGYAAGPVCPHTSGMNVLYVGGNVRTTTSPLIGPNGDHIFQSIYGRPEAGANRSDVVLGRPGDRP